MTQPYSRSLQSMPVELIFLHVRPSDLRDPVTTQTLLSIISDQSAWSSALQILLHRYINPTWNELDLDAFVQFFIALINACSDERKVSMMKNMLLGRNGLIVAFGTGEVTTTPFASRLLLSTLVLIPR
jgi:hypothetical protein